MGLNNEQHDQVMRILQERRMESEKDLLERRFNAYKNIPELSVLDKELFTKGIENFSSDSNVSIESLAKSIHQKKIDLLLDNGFPKDYLEEKHFCPICKDTGYVDGNHCKCFYREVASHLYSQTKVYERFKTETFDSFDLSYYPDIVNPGIKKSPRQMAKTALAKAKEFTDNFSDSFMNMIISGNTGTGKTFLSNCIGGNILDKGYFVLFLGANKMFSIMNRHTFDNSKKFDDADYENIFNCDLLIIDDLGAEMSNYFTNTSIFQCVDDRLLYKKSTIITTNLNMDQLIRTYSERLVSRIIGNYMWVDLYGEDIRIKKRLAN